MRRHLPPEPFAWTALWSRRVALFAAALAALVLALARAKLLAPEPALMTLGVAVALALTALFLFCAACVTIWRSGARGLGTAVGGLFLSVAVLGYPAYLAVQALRLPELADVTTDIDDPPEFSRSKSALAARGAFTPATLAASQRALQREAYPDLEPIIVDLDEEEALALVLKAAAAQGWRLVDQRSPSARSGDAHADFAVRTQILGYEEDATVRLRPMAGQTRIDLRAVSRYGRHDFGANARRIAGFADEMQTQLDQK